MSGAALDFWKKYLAEPRAIVKLPTNLPRPDTPCYDQAVAQDTIPEPTMKAIKAKHGTLTPFLVAAFAVHVHRMSAEEDTVIGAFAAEKDNALPVRVDFSTSNNQQRTFRQVLTSVSDHLNHAKSSAAPLDSIAKAVDATPEAPLFTAAVGVSSSLSEKKEKESKFELFLVIDDTGAAGAVPVRLHYNTALFTAEFAKDLLTQYALLLAGATGAPDASVYSYSLVTDFARRILPDPVAAQDTNWSGAIHMCFHENAKKFPERVAINYEKTTVTYKDLDSLSSQLANLLIKDGIAKGDVVGLYGHRSPAVVLCIMAVFKAGAAYSMMDPAYPHDRISLCMDIAKPKGWLQVAAAGEMPAELTAYFKKLSLKAWHVIDDPGTERLNKLLAGVSNALPQVTVEPQDTAVVTFTSGSTGIPKGVMGKHSPLTAFYPWMSKQFSMSDKDRFAMCSGIAHDPLQRDIFTPLFLGATICIPTQDTITTPGCLARWMHANEITQSCCTPAMGQILITVEDKNFTIPSLKVCLFVGDVLIKRDVLLLHKLAPNVRVVNMFGTTETQRSVGYYEVPRESAKLSKLKDIIPCGRGMKDISLILLNKANKQAGLGESAEIYVRSPHMAKGYVGLPEDTKAKFLPNPLQPTVAWDRWYRTGDLGQYLPSGDVECVGRADDQIKIRGFRIELGEINAKLSGHSKVKESVTVVAKDCSGEKQIVCYVIPVSGATSACPKSDGTGGVIQDQALSQELREYLKTKVPAYMVPKCVVLLRKMPLTPNGKINHKALPSLESLAEGAAGPAPSAEVLARLTPTQRSVLQVFQAILHTPSVGPDDNFFNVGGHSLAAILATMELNRTFSMSLPTSIIFNNQTAARVGTAIDQMKASSASTEDKKVEIDLVAEAVPPEDIRARKDAKPPNAKPIGVMVTGSDGFVGSFVVWNLLEVTDIPIFCFVLADSDADAKAKVKRALTAIERWEDKYETRIVPVSGNLGRPLLGLTQAAFNDLAEKIDAIIHVGAWVNWLHDYNTLKPINVNGTAEVLRLAVTGSRLKSCHHISTTNVYETPQLLCKERIPELLQLEIAEGIGGGYSQTKWVADAMMGNARARGIPVSIYRPGFITGDSKTGKWTTDDFLCRFLKGCIQLGAHPLIPEHLGIDMSPVDYIAGAVVRLALNPTSHGLTYHIVTPKLFPYHRYFESLRRNGFTVKPLPYAEWRKALHDSAAAAAKQSTEGGKPAETNALTAIMPTFTENWLDTRIRPKYERDNVDRFLTNFPFPDIDKTMDVYLRYLVDLGFIPPSSKLQPSGKQHLIITRTAPRPDQR